MMVSTIASAMKVSPSVSAINFLALAIAAAAAGSGVGY